LRGSNSFKDFSSTLAGIQSNNEVLYDNSAHKCTRWRLHFILHDACLLNIQLEKERNSANWGQLFSKKHCRCAINTILDILRNAVLIRLVNQETSRKKWSVWFWRKNSVFLHANRHIEMQTKKCCCIKKEKCNIYGFMCECV
jgi:hypothetical protein